MKVFHRSISSMATRLDMVVAGAAQKACEDLFKKIRAECRRIEGMLSFYQAGSLVSLVNKLAHAGPFH